MSNNTAEYELKLHDNFSHGMHEAKEHADALHHSMEALREVVGEVVAAYVGFEVLKESLGEFEKHQEAVASLSIVYKNNSEYIKENIDQLKELAEVQENTVGIHTEDTMAAEQNLMKYRDLKIGYEELIPVIEDFAKATKTDASEAANLFGRALENPQHAMRLLMQAGIGPRQIQFIENLQKAGKTAEAQAQIFEALKDKYHGVAQAMYEANPLNQIEIQFKQTKEAIGEVEDKILKEFMPIIKDLAESIRNLIHWLEEHKELVKEIAGIIGVVVAGYTAYLAVQKAIALWTEILAFRTKILAAANSEAALTAAAYSGENTVLTATQIALNEAMEANPVGAVIVAITALGVAVYALIENYERLRKEYEDSIHVRTDHVMKNELETVNKLTEGYIKLGYSKDEAAKASLRYEQNMIEAKERHINEKIAETNKEIAAKNERIRTGFLAQIGLPVYVEGEEDQKLADLKSQLTDLAAKKHALAQIAHPEHKKERAAGDNAYAAIKDKSSTVSGNKQVIINVSINKMIGVDKFVGTSKQVVMEAGEQTEKSLLAAVNQFQASIDQ